MDRARSRWIVFAVVLAAVVTLWIVRRPEPPPEPYPRPSGPIVPDLQPTSLDETRAHQLLKHLQDNDLVRYDELAIVRPRPNVRKVYGWPEHDGGRITLTTNGQGLRRDGRVDLAKGGPRILVTGDSHAFGLVDTHETFASLLEARLAARADGRRWEVVNAAVGGTGPYEYVGTVRKLADLAPDLVVAVLFEGNDFLNALRFADLFAPRATEPLDADAQERLDGARRHRASQLTQGLLQAFEFKHRPDGAAVGLEAAIERFAALAAVCEELGARLLVVVLPSKLDVDTDDDRDHVAELLDELDLSASEHGINRRLGLAFADAMEELGIPVVDLLEPLRAASSLVFWRKDHHLNVEGHAHVARALLPHIVEILAPDG